MQNTDEDLKSYYALRASEYDRVYEKPERQADIRILKQWLPSRFIGQHVFEIACGTGYWTQYIAPLASDIVAIDSSIETIKIAKTRVSKDKVQFFVADAYLLPKTLGVFDAVFAGFWFSHIPKNLRRNFINGMNKHLKPGAKVVFVDNRYVEGSNHPITECDSEGNTYQTRKLADGSLHRVLKNFPSENELLELFGKDCGKGMFTQYDYYWAFEFETEIAQQAHAPEPLSRPGDA